MSQRGNIDSFSPSYDVDDEALSERIDEMLEELKPYPHLDLIREVLVTGAKLAQEGCDRGDLKILRSSIKELRYAFKVFADYRDVPKVTIFGSSRSQPDDPVFQTAVEFGRKIAEDGYKVITGAGEGIMGAGHVGAGRENSFGLNISLPFEQSANQTIAGDRKLINFRYFFTRKLFFVKESKAIVLMPGGLGTQDEGFETLTLVQTGRSEPTPIVMLDGPGGTYWKDWHQFFQKELLASGYVSPEDEALFLITDDLEEARQEILNFYHGYHSSRYVDRGRKLVVRLKHALSEESIKSLNEEFQDIVLEGSIEACDPYEEEGDEPDLLELPRLSLSFNRRNFGRLRQLIDRINSLG
jgi:uncharacterized protein (TIGR00730 family)